MPAALPVELRQRVVEARINGEGTIEAVGARFKVHASSVKRWVKLEKTEGDLSPSTAPRGPAPLFDEEQLTLLEQLLRENADATLVHLTELFNDASTLERTVSRSTVGRAVRERLGWTRKKSRWKPMNAASTESASCGADTGAGRTTA